MVQKQRFFSEVLELSCCHAQGSCGAGEVLVLKGELELGKYTENSVSNSNQDNRMFETRCQGTFSKLPCHESGKKSLNNNEINEALGK